jgi:hypothetical protein
LINVSPASAASYLSIDVDGIVTFTNPSTEELSVTFDI